jgi:hypothetical protein
MTCLLSEGSGGFLRVAGVRNTTQVSETNLLGPKDGPAPFLRDGRKNL